MKKLGSRLALTASFLLMTSGLVFAQAPMKDVLKETAKEGAMEMLGVKKPVQGQAEMMDGAKMMLDDLTKKGMLKADQPSEGETMLKDGERMLKNGEMMMLK